MFSILFLVTILTLTTGIPLKSMQHSTITHPQPLFVPALTSNSRYVTVISDWPGRSSFQPYFLDPIGNTVWVSATSTFNAPSGQTGKSEILNFTLGGTPKTNFTVNVPIIPSVAYDPIQHKLWFPFGENLAAYDTVTGSSNYTIETSLPHNSNPYSVAVDKNSHVWVTFENSSQIDMYDPAAKTNTLYRLPTNAAGPWGLTVANDTTIWFTEALAKKIGHLTPCPQTNNCITEYSPPASIILSAPVQLTLGDGLVWFTDHGSNMFGSFNPSTQEWRTYPIGYCFVDCASGLPNAISFDSHGKLWFSEHIAGRIAEYDPINGRLVEYVIHSPTGAYSWWAWPGPNNLVWFTSLGLSQIGYVNASIPVPLNITAPTGIVVQRGSSASIPVQLSLGKTYSGTNTFSVAVSPTTVDYPGNGFVNQLSNYSSTVQLDTSTNSHSMNLPISAAWNATLGARNVAITVSNGDVNVNTFVQVTVTDSNISYLTVGIVGVILLGAIVLFVKRPRRTRRPVRKIVQPFPRQSPQRKK